MSDNFIYDSVLFIYLFNWKMHVFIFAIICCYVWDFWRYALHFDQINIFEANEC